MASRSVKKTGPDSTPIWLGELEVRTRRKNSSTRNASMNTKPRRTMDGPASSSFLPKTLSRSPIAILDLSNIHPHPCLIAVFWRYINLTASEIRKPWHDCPVYPQKGCLGGNGA